MPKGIYKRKTKAEIVMERAPKEKTILVKRLSKKSDSDRILTLIETLVKKL